MIVEAIRNIITSSIQHIDLNKRDSHTRDDSVEKKPSGSNPGTTVTTATTTNSPFQATVEMPRSPTTSDRWSIKHVIFYCILLVLLGVMVMMLLPAIGRYIEGTLSTIVFIFL